MILWTGWEVLVVVFILVGQAAAYLIAMHLSGDLGYIDMHGWALGAGCFAPAMMCRLLDAWVTKSIDRAWRDPQTGPPPGSAPCVRLAPDPLVQWYHRGDRRRALFYHQTPEQLWQSLQAETARMEAWHRQHEPSPTAIP